MRLNEDELRILEKVKIFDRQKGKIFMDYNASGINVTLFLFIFACVVLVGGIALKEINVGLGILAGMCFVGSVFQMALQFRTLGALVRKQSLLINDFIGGYALPDDSLKLPDSSLRKSILNHSV